MPIHEGRRQGGPDSPVLWNSVVDEAMEETLRT